MKYSIDEITSSISHKLSDDIPKMPEVDLSSVKVKSTYHKAKVVAMIVAVITVLTLSGCYVARQIYFGNMVYFKDMKNDEYVTIVNETKTLEDKEVTLQAVMTDGLNTYARLKLGGEFEEAPLRITNMCVMPDSMGLQNKVPFACIVDSETGKIHPINFFNQLQTTNTVSASPQTDEDMDSILDENEIILTFDTPIKDNHKFELKLLLYEDYLKINGSSSINDYLRSDDIITFQDLSVKCPKTETINLSKKNISFSTKYDTMKVSGVTRTVLHTYIDVMCSPKEKYKISDNCDMDYSSEYYDNSDKYFFRLSYNGDSENIENIWLQGDNIIRFGKTEKGDKIKVDLYKCEVDEDGNADYGKYHFVKNVGEFEV